MFSVYTENTLVRLIYAVSEEQRWTKIATRALAFLIGAILALV